jgi:hypothetical protein
MGVRMGKVKEYKVVQIQMMCGYGWGHTSDSAL